MAYLQQIKLSDHISICPSYLAVLFKAEQFIIIINRSGESGSLCPQSTNNSSHNWKISLEAVESLFTCLSAGALHLLDFADFWLLPEDLICFFNRLKWRLHVFHTSLTWG